MNLDLTSVTKKFVGSRAPVEAEQSSRSSAAQEQRLKSDLIPIVVFVFAVMSMAVSDSFKDAPKSSYKENCLPSIC
jgi:hypothetical protein